ncbi:PD-(D/E)XK nuclease family protein [Heliorestis convoluta]|uniref:PD-(D/E)XK endonuclease-like domain-containing protein n=1 Tax=Heliorestis convoluta TaxID=356322 RepID=A0A5Q2N306_9FIRM|nr:PD-(D/E)XK nuclease family protein [Heliorestis convoluta]QGG47672.1 hypothetical protein FTV88_1572 [Heliorestis convoluta]
MVSISSLINRKGAKELRDEVLSHREDRGTELTTAILEHFDNINSFDVVTDRVIEEIILQDELSGLQKDSERIFPKGITSFSPSSAYKCERELYFKAKRYAKIQEDRFPYQRRWARNGTAVHGATQKDLLYAEKYLDKPLFKVARTKKENRPAWEKNIRTGKQFTHQDQSFQLYGMMDGVLIYQKDNSKIGFEFKTKSTTLGAIGNYRMKELQPDHKEQCVAYSLLFGVTEFLVVYESLAKDGWTKGIDAKPDMRAFYLAVTKEEQQRLLDKFATVAAMIDNDEIPPADESKCFFCPYKPYCQALEGEVAA